MKIVSGIILMVLINRLKGFLVFEVKYFLSLVLYSKDNITSNNQLFDY